MPKEKKTVELKEEQLEQVVGGKTGGNSPICFKGFEAGPCNSNDFNSYESCHSCKKNPENMD